jgi:[ribosomal protein S5]-alanine N-acetyltransferase
VDRVITTPRLFLRKLRPGDLDALHAMYADTETMRFIGNGDAATREESAQALLEAIEAHERYGYGLLGMVLRESGDLVGRCGYKVWQVDGKDHLEIGWMVHRDHVGLGYATEAGFGLREHAFTSLGWEEVISVIQPGNLASIRVAEKVGESYWRDWTTPGGQKVRLYRVERGVSEPGSLRGALGS